MIENLHGIHETVNFKENTNIRLYDNDKFEHYPEHWHTPLEILMPVESDYTAKCLGHAFHLRTNDILIICPGVIHSLMAPERGRRIIFQAEFSMLHSIQELESVLTIISPALLITPEDNPKIHDRIRRLMLEIRDEYLNDSPLAEACIYSRLIEIMVLVGRNHTDQTERYEITGFQKQREFIEKFLSICNYINEHCTEDISLDEVAELAGFSKYHFSRLFKQFTNVSFYKYMNQKRIAAAEKLLLDPQLTVTDIALQSGFSSMSTFVRMFKIIKGCTPKEFRSMYNNN